MKILRFLGALVCSMVICGVIWSIWHSIAPWVFDLSWFWFIVFAMVLSAIVMTQLVAVVWFPVISMVKYDRWIGVGPALMVLLFAACSVYDVWTLDVHYGFKQIAVGITLTVNILMSFWSLGIGSFMYQGK